MNIPELLSPAGNYTNFLAALENGADAIYMGLSKYNARAMAENFTLNDYKKAIKLAHLKGVKIYLTLNTLLHDEEIKEALNMLAELVSVGLDAIIVQDIGLATAVHQVFPNLPIHGSTQMTVHNLDGVKVLKRLGFTRVVLARELSLEEIRYIKENSNIELEVFVHGAACVAYSGACSLSELVGGRSANRGKCAQPCRLRYELFDDADERIAIGHLLSNKDIFGLPYIEELSKMGIHSLKIEGRNRTPDYVAVATRKYRKYLDIIEKDLQVDISSEDENELLQVFNRGGKHSHYFEGKKGKDSISYLCPKNWGIPLGKVVDIHGSMIKVKLFTTLNMHDGVEILEGTLSGIVTCIRDDKRNLINDTVGEDRSIWIGDFKKHEARIGDILYKTSSSKINEKYKPTYSGKYHFKKNYLSVIVTIKEGYPLSLEIYNDDFNLKVTGSSIAEKATKAPITAEIIEEKLDKTKDSPFIFSNIVYDIEKDLFIPISEVNKLKQLALEKMEEFYDVELDLTDERVRIKTLDDEHNSVINMKTKETRTDLFLYSYNEHIDYASYKPNRIYLDYQLALKNPELIDKFSYIADIFIALPPIYKGKIRDIIKSNIPKWQETCKGFLISNIGYFELFSNYPNTKLIGDHTLNIYNNFSINAYRNLGLSGFTLSLELTEDDVKKLDLRDATIIAEGEITAMTTEYCVVGSFAGGFTSESPCRKPCTISNKYYLVDPNGEEMPVECNPIDCSCRIMRHYKCSYDILDLRPARMRYNLR